MATHQATVVWKRHNEVFTDNRYSRAHTWSFDGGVAVPASSSPHVVPLPYSEVKAVDPEEAFVASLSSCHMLWFLGLAAGRGWRVDEYTDNAVGILTTDGTGRQAMTEVTLRPQVVFSGEHVPSTEELRALHDAAHHRCYIANSVKTEVKYEIVE